jgi:hypothetical protein
MQSSVDFLCIEAAFDCEGLNLRNKGCRVMVTLLNDILGNLEVLRAGVPVIDMSQMQHGGILQEGGQLLCGIPMFGWELELRRLLSMTVRRRGQIPQAKLPACFSAVAASSCFFTEGFLAAAGSLMCHCLAVAVPAINEDSMNTEYQSDVSLAGLASLSSNTDTRPIA